MTYEEAKTVVNSGAFNSCYARLADNKKKFKKLYDDGPFRSSTRSFEDIKNDEQAFRSGNTNIYYTLVDNYENDLLIVYKKVAEYLNLAIGHCTSVQNGMDTDRNALAAALKTETDVYNDLAPHKVDVYDDNGNVIGEDDLSDEHRAMAIAEAEKVWYGMCCMWSK